MTHNCYCCSLQRASASHVDYDLRVDRPDRVHEKVLMRSDKEQRRRLKEEEKRREGGEQREQDYDGRDLDDGTHHFSHRRKSALKDDTAGGQLHQGKVDTDHYNIRVSSPIMTQNVPYFFLSVFRVHKLRHLSKINTK